MEKSKKKKKMGKLLSDILREGSAIGNKNKVKRCMKKNLSSFSMQIKRLFCCELCSSKKECVSFIIPQLL